MKSLVLITVLLASIQALAFPKVGDRAHFVGTLAAADGSTAAITLTLEITEYDSAADKYKVARTITNSAQPTLVPVTSESWSSPAELASDAELAALLAGCTQRGGVLENITVKAGRFDTCKISHDAVTIHFGNVPFGILSFSASPVTYELESYTSN